MMRITAKPTLIVGLLVLALLGLASRDASAGVIVNPSFESEHGGSYPSGGTITVDGYAMPDSWSWQKNGAMNGHGIRSDAPAGWSSSGNWSLYVFSSISGTHHPGDFLEFYQPIDFTGVGTISFDVYLRGGTYTNSYLAVDSQKLWVRNQSGVLHNVTVDVSGFQGMHDLTLGVEVFEAFGTSADGWTYFDNLTVIPEPATLSLLALGGLLVLRRRGPHGSS